MRRNVHLWVLAGCSLLPATALAQPCPVPCNGTQVNCSHQNGIRNNTGLANTNPANVAPLAGPNAAAPGGNVAGDAEWKVWGCENGMTRGSGVHTVTSWEVGLLNNLPGATTATYDIPNFELRPVVLGAAGLRIPDVAAVPLAAFGVGMIALPAGAFRVNVSIGQGITALASCTPTTYVPTLSNADVAMLFLYAPGGSLNLPLYVFQVQTQNETTVLSNGGNSYSGTFNAGTGALTSYAPNQELFGELGFFEPTLEILRQTAGFAVPSTGAGARELAAGDTVVFRSEDWAAGIAAIAGQSRMAGVLFSEPSGGNPLCQPGLAASFLQGSIFVPGSPGVAAIFPTPLTFALLSYSAWVGNGMNCHAIGDVACGTSGIPSVFSDMRAQTPPIVVPPGPSLPTSVRQVPPRELL